jgi:hypothetical protein
METVSENAPARKRGRPPVFSARDLQIAEAAAEPGQTPRNIANVAYRLEALSVLLHAKEPERFNWLSDNERIRRGEGRAWKPTILTELGRLGDTELIEAFALRLDGQSREGARHCTRP